MADHGTWRGVPREQVPWYPTLDPEKCIGCRKCFEFCSHGVCSWDQTNDKPVAAQPFQCVVGCSSCSRQCEQEAIIFAPLAILKGIGV